MTTTATPSRRGKRLAWGVEAALCCGILAPLISVGVDRVAGALWHGDSFTARSASELTAVGPHAGLRSCALSRLRRAAGHLRAGRAPRGMPQQGAAHRRRPAHRLRRLSLIAAAAFPAHLGRTTEPASAGVFLSAAALLCIIAAIATGAFAFRTWFRVDSLATLMTFAVFTVLGLTVQSTPHIGLQERTNGYLYLLWVLGLAGVLLRSEVGDASRQQKEGSQS